ncbi:MAG: ATP-grasp domain-containing protein [Candidatus Gracilibacteria bacterium]|nr:ATP-grasp domain-containing protein [Candidatus Gracilibacteria bacterium]
MSPLFILSGGPGNEHDVSLVSGRNVFEKAKSFGIDTHLVTISKNREWIFGDDIKSETTGIQEILAKNGVVFPLIHGTYGEDGKLQSLFEQSKVPFIGSGQKAMELTIDKQRTGDFLLKQGFRVPKSFEITNALEIHTIDVDFPVIVKPRDEGSSISLYKVQNIDELLTILTKELSFRKEILVQEFVKGREFTCGVVEIGGKVVPLLPTEIILTKGDLFDYDAKYKSGGCEEITPAEVDPEMIKSIQSIAMKVHETCGCKDISRTDMILNSRGEFVVLEVNTIPGMTGTSFIPAQLTASGYSTEIFIHSMMNKYSK